MVAEANFGNFCDARAAGSELRDGLCSCFGGTQLKRFKVVLEESRLGTQFTKPKGANCNLYKSSAILLNSNTCLYKSGQTVQRFAVSPPSLEEYINEH